MYLMDVNIDDVKRELSSNHVVTNNKLVQETYNFVSEQHKDHKRKNGELYIKHLLRVAKSIAEWGFESDAICAALLHDSLDIYEKNKDEISEKFGSEVSDLLDSFKLFEARYESFNGTGLNTISSALFASKVLETAFYIAVADRLDNLNTLACFSEDSKLQKANKTREFFIPLLKNEGAFYLVNIFEDLCFKIEQPDKYDLITHKYQQLLNANSYTTNSILNLFEESFNTESLQISKEYRFYLDYVIKFKTEERSMISIYRQVLAAADSTPENICDAITKSNTALYDLTLVISDEEDEERELIRPKDLQPLDIFFKVFEEVLTKHGVYIIGTQETSYGDTNYLLLKDGMNNMYRLFIKTKKDYLHCQLGHLVEKDNFDIKIKNDKNITVFTSKGEAKKIEDGATFLDFAFLIHSFLGYHFDYALVKGSEARRQANDKIYPGYEITIVTKPYINPEINWFRHVKTARATDALVHYFNAQKNAENEDKKK